MTCDVFIRSYRKDLGWLTLCLESVRRYCHGFGETIVVIPRSSAGWVRRAALPDGARIELCADYGDDYLGQQVSKLTADSFSDADFVCYVDSDCIFTQPTAPDDLISGGRPFICWRPLASLGRERPWHRPTEKFLGWPVDRDYMYHPPFTFPRWLLSRVREHSLLVHGVEIERYVMAQPPRGFSEFNVLGAYAWEFHRSSFSWIEPTTTTPADPRCRWYWSWGGIDAGIRAEITSILRTAPLRD